MTRATQPSPPEPATWTVERGPRATVVVGPNLGACNVDVIEPADWRERLVAALEHHGGHCGIVAKRVTSGGAIAAMGEFVVHPKGLHGLGRGAPRVAYRFPEEVDGALGGVAAFPSELVATLEPPRGPLGLLTWCLEARLRGARVFAVPEVVCVDDAPLAIGVDDLRAFVTRFGFHPFAPDIDAIAARKDIAALRWNARFFGAAQPFEKYVERGAFHWTAYAEHAAFRQRADMLVDLAAKACGHGAGDVVDVGCGDGLFTAKLAERGLPVVGVDDDAAALDLAARTSSATTNAARFVRGSAYALPFANASARGAILFDVIEHLHNPTRALRELARVIARNGGLVLSTPEWQFGASSDPTYHVCEYTLDELTRLVCAEGLFAVERTARIGGAYRDLVVVARRA
ncbi:MAG: class I SAM-dependent methyltransferase [Phycisphaerales bacterium]